MKRLSCLIVIAAFFAFGCSSAPEKDDKPVVESTVEKLEPTAEKLAECPCGEADWSKPPPGAPASSGQEKTAEPSVE